MRFVDDLYALYKDQLTGNENDVIALVLNIMSEQSRQDLMKFINDMSEGEIKQMISLYLVELLKSRLVKEGIMEQDRYSQDRPYH